MTHTKIATINKRRYRRPHYPHINIALLPIFTQFTADISTPPNHASHTHTRRAHTPTLGSLLSSCLAISSSLGNPPAVTSDARVKVQYDSLLLVAADIMVVGWVRCFVLLGHWQGPPPCIFVIVSLRDRLSGSAFVNHQIVAARIHLIFPILLQYYSA